MSRRGYIYEFLVRLFYGLDIIVLVNVWMYVYIDFNKLCNLRNYVIEIIEKIYIEYYILSKVEFIYFGWIEMIFVLCLFIIEYGNSKKRMNCFNVLIFRVFSKLLGIKIYYRIICGFI